MNTSQEFTRETYSLIFDMEEKSQRERRCQAEITANDIRFINLLIKRYDEIVEKAKSKATQKEKTLYVNGKKYKISRYHNRGNDIREINKAVLHNSFDNKAEYKCIIEDSCPKRKKRFKAYRIKRFARLLKVAKETDGTLFANFIKIPDVKYTLRVIEKNEFGDLDIYLGK